MISARETTIRGVLPVVDPLPLRPADLPRDRISALYVHVPFCFHKCHYCDFYSITRQSPERMSAFVDRVLAEADLWTTTDGPQVLPRTVFFGGGTPSLLPAGAMRRLIDGLRRRFDFSHVIEFTVEVNPATADGEYCRMLRACGVDRLSFGGQSFDRGELATLERHHDPDDVPRSIDLARAAGFERLNVDLIFAIPGQTMGSWQESVRRTLALSTGHVSCYALTYEPNTPLAVKKRLGRIVAVEESLEVDMLAWTRQYLADAGVPAYEISNFAAPGQACRHNLNYWDGGSYLGLGPSAASHAHGSRWKNRPHLGEWEAAIDAGQLPVVESEHLDPARRAGEHAMLRLRLTEGIAWADFGARWNLDARTLFADPVARYSAAGLLRADERGVRLTERGVPVADALAGEFLAAASGSAKSSDRAEIAPAD